MSDINPIPRGGSSGGTAIEIDQHAWIEADGVNATAAVGDPAKPYLTMAAAYTAGARVFHLGVGTFAGLSLAGAVNIKYIGSGRDLTTITLIDSTNAGFLTMQDIGHYSALVTTIGRNGANGVDDPSSPTAGGSVSQVALYGVLYGTLQLIAGNGGNNNGDGDGGAGGSAGSVSLMDCLSGGATLTLAGNGGVFSGSGVNGATGSHGGFTCDRSYLVGVTVFGETLGGQIRHSLFSGHTFSSASIGSLDIYHSRLTGGSVSNVNLVGSFIETDTTWNDSGGAHGSLINGTWQD